MGPGAHAPGVDCCCDAARAAWCESRCSCTTAVCLCGLWWCMHFDIRPRTARHGLQASCKPGPFTLACYACICCRSGRVATLDLLIVCIQFPILTVPTLTPMLHKPQAACDGCRSLTRCSFAGCHIEFCQGVPGWAFSACLRACLRWQWLADQPLPTQLPPTDVLTVPGYGRGCSSSPRVCDAQKGFLETKLGWHVLCCEALEWESVAARVCFSRRPIMCAELTITHHTSWSFSLC